MAPGTPRRPARPGDPERTVERIAHALTPWEWSGPALAAGIVAFAVVGVVTVVQRALVAEGVVGWWIVAIHGGIVAVVVPALSWRAVRRWRARRGRAV